MSLAEIHISSAPAAPRKVYRLQDASSMGLVVVAFHHMRRNRARPKSLADTAGDLAFCLGLIEQAARSTAQPATFRKGFWHVPFVRQYSPRLRQLMAELDRDLKLLCRHRASRSARRQGIAWACNQLKAVRAALADVDDPESVSLCACAKSLCMHWYNRWHEG
ncbi:MAG: hypothetical protein ABFD92_17080 [Planctomycetaceae bacterium]|nr:hypothetical protein [Planctomycetaceae bacterium]